MNKKFLLLIRGGIFLIGFVSLYLSIVLGFWVTQKEKIYPKVKVAGIDVSGMKKKDATELIQSQEAEYLEKDFIFNGKKVNLKDINVQFGTAESVKQAQKLGEENPFILGFSKDIPLLYSYDEEKLFKIIKKSEEEIRSEVKESEIKKNGAKITVMDGQNGKRVNYAQTEKNFQESLSNLKSTAELSVFEIGPTFTASDFEVQKEALSEKIAENLELTAEEKTFKVSPEEIYSWLEISSKNRSLTHIFEREEILSPLFESSSQGSIYSASKIKDYLKEISSKINTDPVNAKLAIEGGRATVFVPSKAGKSLDIDQSVEAVIEALENKEKKVGLKIETTEPEVQEGSLNEMGIKELLATGFSNFAGSPSNRRHNIRTGASKFNGVLIKPGETFSFVKALGPVDASTGYLPELVIKENKTIPEYGGGMCQVSSTAFRAALNAGLPIISRSAHSYPVTYYKPYGVDATVYIPKPDLSFKNDTGKYILIQTRISGNNLYFDFYGTKPARSVSFSGYENGAGSVSIVEKVSPNLYDQGARGRGSFTAVFYRFIADSTGKKINTKYFVSKYDSPDKYPH